MASSPDEFPRRPPDSRTPPKAGRALRWVCIVVSTILLTVLVLFVGEGLGPGPTKALLRGQMVQTVNNARQIFLAASAMAEDGLANGDSRFGWPGDLAVSPDNPVPTLSGYVERLIEGGYIKRADAAKLFWAPGMVANRSDGPFDSARSAFKIYRFGKVDDPDCLAIGTKNYTFGRELDAKQVPYGRSGAVILRKGGVATPLYDKVAPKNMAPVCLPGHHPGTDSGAETAESILKM